MKYIMVLLLVCTSLFSSEENNNKWIELLKHPEWETRYEATRYLMKLPFWYAKKFLIRSYEETDLEAKTRLYTIAQNIYQVRTILLNDKYLKSRGIMGLDMMPLHVGETGVYFFIKNRWGPSEGKLNQWDVITKVNGVTLDSSNFKDLYNTLGIRRE